MKKSDVPDLEEFDERRIIMSPIAKIYQEEDRKAIEVVNYHGDEPRGFLRLTAYK